MLCSQVETEPGSSHVQTHSLFVWKRTQVCWGNTPTKCPFRPSREKLAFCTKGEKETAPAVCSTDGVCVSPVIWCFKQQGELGIQSTSSIHLSSVILLQVTLCPTHFLQKMGLIQRRLEAATSSVPVQHSQVEPGCGAQSRASVLTAPTPISQANGPPSSSNGGTSAI